MKITMKNSEEKSSNGGVATSIANPTSSSPNGNSKIRIAVFGQHEVGKSALTVRYLTRRYIGEYKSNTDLLYRQTVTVGHTCIDVEIVDISTSSEQSAESKRKSFPVEEIPLFSAFVIVYSITDRSSFTFALDALEMITTHYNHNGTMSSQNSLSTSSSSGASSSSSTNSSPNASPQPKATCPILLVANKNDLEHLRTVEKVEGLSASMQYGCNFQELSVAENSPEVYTSFQSLISTFVTQNQQPSKRKFSVSKMLGNLRIGRTSPSHPVVTSQASIIDTNVISNSSEGSENIPAASTVFSQSAIGNHQRQSSVPETSTVHNGGSSGSGLTNSICHLKSKLVELHSMKKRHNSPPICSL